MPLRFLKEGMDFPFGETEHESIYLGQVSETPADGDIGEGNTAFYAKADGNLYKRPYGGTESRVGGGSSGSFDHLLSETLDAQGNDIANVGSLQAADADINELLKSFGTDEVSNVPGEDMHDLYRVIYDRDGGGPVGLITLVNYNDSGSGWFADEGRQKAGLRLYGINGRSGGLVELATFPPNGPAEFPRGGTFGGSIDAQGNDIDNVGSLQTTGTQVAEQLDIPVYSDDANSPNATHFFNDTEGALKYKDESGTVHEGSGSGSDGGDVSNPMTTDLDAGGNSITNAASVDMQSGSIQDSPVDPTDIANRDFVESEVSDIDLSGVDVSELSGSAGQAGQVPQTDGTNVQWNDIETGSFDHALSQTLDAQDQDITNVDTVQARKTSTGPISVLTSNAGRGGVYGTQKPAAVYSETDNTTFWVFRGEDADPYVSGYDHDQEKQLKIRQVAESTLGTADNHGPPTLSIDGNGILHVIFGAHDSDFQYARSVNPYDSSEWEDMGYLDTVPAGTYPSQTTLNGDTYILYRTGGHGNSGNMDYPNHDRATIIRTQDGGDTWEDLGPAIDITDHPNRPSDVYPMELQTHDGELRVTWHLAVSQDGGHDGDRMHVSHAAFDPATDEWRAMDGTTYTAPITWADMSSGAIRAFDGMSAGVSTYVEDDGTPHLTFHHWVEATSEVEIRHAWFDGGWNNETIGQAGSAFTLSTVFKNDAGNIEVHGPTNDVLADNRGRGGVRGGSYTRFEKVNGSWESEVLIDKHDARVSNIQAVRNGTKEFRTISVEHRLDPRTWDARLFASGTLNTSTSTRLAGKNYPVIPQKEPLSSEPTPGDDFLNWGSTSGGEDRLFLGTTRPGAPDTDTLTLGGSTNWFNRVGMRLIGSSAQLILDESGTLDHQGSTTSDPTLPDSGVRKYLRTDTPSPQYRMRESGGSLASLPLNDGTVISDGDGTERQIWVIPAGAADPEDAAPEDIIFEEEG